MDYLQSLENIAVIKDRIRLYKETSCIFFNFTDFQNFEIIFIENTDNLAALRASKEQHDLPLALIYMDDLGQEILHYRDVIVDLDYNLTLDQTNFNVMLQINRVNLLNQYSSILCQIKK